MNSDMKGFKVLTESWGVGTERTFQSLGATAWRSPSLLVLNRVRGKKTDET